jgi:hypothetical protein
MAAKKKINKRALRKKKPKSKSNHAPKRTKGQIQEDRVVIAKMYCEAKPLWQITSTINERIQDRGEKYTLTYQAIQNDLRWIRRVWEREQSEWFNRFVSEQLARIDNVERTLWEEYWDSKKEKMTTIVKGKGQKDNKGNHKNYETIVKKEQRLGDPRYLEAVVRCLEMRQKLLKPETDTKDEEWAQRKVMLFQQTVNLMRETVPSGPVLDAKPVPKIGDGGNGTIIKMDSKPTIEEDGGNGDP